MSSRITFILIMIGAIAVIGGAFLLPEFLLPEQEIEVQQFNAKIVSIEDRISDHRNRLDGSRIVKPLLTIEFKGTDFETRVIRLFPSRFWVDWDWEEGQEICINRVRNYEIGYRWKFFIWKDVHCNEPFGNAPPAPAAGNLIP